MSQNEKIAPATWWALGLTYAGLAGLIAYDPAPFLFLLAIVWPN